ncbi:MAG: pyridoxamine 5'-phosphate oxidase family protein [Acidimicrobiales bacterium]
MSIPVTDRTRLRRLPERGRHELAEVAAVLDEALYCHVGITTEQGPVVIPTIHARVGDQVVLHGSPASRLLRTLKGGVPMCLTATLVDGLVVARSAFHHSLNYRSAVVFGEATEVVDPAAKAEALDALVDHVLAGRAAEARPGSPKELKGTTVLTLPLTEASVKVRTGPPIDEEDDLPLDVWAGVVPLQTVAGTPEPSPDLAAGIPVPPSVLGLRATAG